jgi:(p)ppGpp synthase/HD superfamily hydrolase
MKLSERFRDALGVAHDFHLSDLRKGTQVPYVSHVIAVASIALEHGADEDQAIAALLHDSLEDAADDRDAAARAALIGERFGPEVLRIVEGLSDARPDAEGRKPAWRARKQAYLDHLAAVDSAIALVSAADKLHNARAILGDLRDPEVGEGLWRRFNAGRDDQLWYYGGLVTALRRHVPVRLHMELERSVQDMWQHVDLDRHGYAPASPEGQ